MTRQVHPNNMVAHLWAHQSQESARTSNGNLWFNGGVLYSYSTPIANFVTDKNGNRVALISERCYSPTTGQHLSAARSALGYSDNKVAPYYTVPWIDASGGRCSRFHHDHNLHEENVKHFLDSYSTMLKSAKRSRSLWGGEQDRLQSIIDETLEYATRFNVVVALPNLVEDWQTVIDYRAKRKTPEALAKREKERLARVERSRRDYREVKGIYGENWSDLYRYRHLNTIFTDDDKLARRTNLSIINADRVSAWRNGLNVRLDWNNQTLMRVKGDNIETSRGAVFPVEHGKRAFAFIKSCRDNGRAYTRNGHSIPLGHFTIDSIDMSGNVKAGCHYVEWSEIDYVARQLGLLRRYTATMRVEKGEPWLGKFDSLWAESENEAKEKFLANKSEYHKIKDLEIKLADD